MVTDIISMQLVLNFTKKNLLEYGTRQHLNCNVSKLVQFIAQSNFNCTHMFIYSLIVNRVICR